MADEEKKAWSRYARVEVGFRLNFRSLDSGISVIEFLPSNIYTQMQEFSRKIIAEFEALGMEYESRAFSRPYISVALSDSFDADVHIPLPFKDGADNRGSET